MSQTEATDRVAKVCTKVKMGDQASDFAYWQAQPYEARLAALEKIRQEYHCWSYGAEQGFQRICSIVKR